MSLAGPVQTTAARVDWHLHLKGGLIRATPASSKSLGASVPKQEENIKSPLFSSHLHDPFPCQSIRIFSDYLDTTSAILALPIAIH